MALLAEQHSLEERVRDLLECTEYRKMDTVEDRYLAYRLRHDAYVREGCIDETPDGTSTDCIDDEPNTHTYGVFILGKLVSSVRISVLTQEARNSTAMMNNRQVLDPMLDEGMIIIDPSRFSADAIAAREFPELPYLTLRVAVMACEHYLADECLSYCRPEHRAFYRRVFQSKPIADKLYFDLLRMYVQLMSTKVGVIREDVMRRYPFFRSNYLERRALFGPASLIPGIPEGRVNLIAA